jgi:phospholipid/cholesterol/gamma-HCH transport system substrate-binding protein
VPLNNGDIWKGAPNATLSGRPIPQPRTVVPPTAAPAATQPPVAIAEYDPATGSYVGPDGKTYTQTDLAQRAPQNPTWQSMLVPPAG